MLVIEYIVRIPIVLPLVMHDPWTRTGPKVGLQTRIPFLRVMDPMETRMASASCIAVGLVLNCNTCINVLFGGAHHYSCQLIYHQGPFLSFSFSFLAKKMIP